MMEFKSGKNNITIFKNLIINVLLQLKYEGERERSHFHRNKREEHSTNVCKEE